MSVTRIECAGTVASLDAARRAQAFSFDFTLLRLLAVVAFATIILGARAGLSQAILMGGGLLAMAIVWRGVHGLQRAATHPSAPAIGHADLDERGITLQHGGRHTEVEWSAVKRITRTRREHLVWLVDGRVVALALGNPTADALLVQRGSPRSAAPARSLGLIAVLYVVVTMALPSALSRWGFDAHLAVTDRLVCGRP